MLVLVHRSEVQFFKQPFKKQTALSVINRWIITTTSRSTKQGWESALHVAKYETDCVAVRAGQSQQQSGQLFTAISTLDKEP